MSESPAGRFDAFDANGRFVVIRDEEGCSASGDWTTWKRASRSSASPTTTRGMSEPRNGGKAEAG